MVPLAMLSPPKFAYLSWRSWLFLMLADRIRRGERLGRNCRRPRFPEIWEKTGPGPSKQVRNPPVHIWSEGQSQVRVLSGGGLVFHDRSHRPSKRSSRLEKNNPSNAGSISGLVERHDKRQTDFQKRGIFRGHVKFDVVKGICQKNIATQLNTNPAANRKAVV